MLLVGRSPAETAIRHVEPHAIAQLEIAFGLALAREKTSQSVNAIGYRWHLSKAKLKGQYEVE